jgi:quercetin dioxygenase-like cupin family protein
MRAILTVSAAFAVSCSGAPAPRDNPAPAPAPGEPAAGQPAAHDHQASELTPVVILRPEQLDWKPAGVLPPGASMAIVEGSPAEPGFFALRLKLPPGYRIPPHHHPAVERVTVLEGTFFLGHGEAWDDDALEAHETGSYLSMPVGMRHFAAAGDEEVVIQLASIGPWGITYVDPEDDPRK